MRKAELRRSLLKTRQAMPVEAWRQKSNRITSHLQASPLFTQAQTVLAYFSFRQEPDLSSLFADTERHWGFPRAMSKSLFWHRWKPGEPLQAGNYGISEPHPNAPAIEPTEVDLILVPAVACDRQGMRLGYGGGFYDRMLGSSEWVSHPTIGIVFEFAYLSQLPVDLWDKPLHSVCTETGCHTLLMKFELRKQLKISTSSPRKNSRLNFTRSQNSKHKTIVIYGLLVAIALLMLFPLLWLISTSLKSSTENLFQFPPQILPSQPTLGNFVKVWQTSPFGQYLFNSTLVSVLTVTLSLLFCSLAAYPLARLDFRGRDLFFAGVVSTIMIPFQIVMIPLYILTVQLGLRNTYLGVILPSIASAFGIFLLRQAFQGVPKELEEAARMDGCSELGLWWCVMLPAIRPALVTLAIFDFIGSWSDFLWPLIVLDRPEYYTLPLGVATLAGTFSLDWRLIAAGSVISIAPVLLFFIFLQQYIVSTDTSSGVKG